MSREAEQYNLAQILAGTLDITRITELVTQFQLRNNLLADGMFGPATQSRMDEFVVNDRPPDRWSPWRGPLGRLPDSRRETYRIFGNPGAGTLDKAWYRDNIVELHQTRGNELPFVPSWQYVMLHMLAEPYAREGLRRAQLSCPSYAIERVGSFNFRHQQSNPARPLSYHAFGVALDVDPHKNPAKRFASDSDKPVPFTKEWNLLYPEGIPSAFVQAMESCGWFWGGWWPTFADPQHFQLVS